jgi:hypothetical protein
VRNAPINCVWLLVVQPSCILLNEWLTKPGVIDRRAEGNVARLASVVGAGLCPSVLADCARQSPPRTLGLTWSACLEHHQRTARSRNFAVYYVDRNPLHTAYGHQAEQGPEIPSPCGYPGAKTTRARHHVPPSLTFLPVRATEIFQHRPLLHCGVTKPNSCLPG